MKIIVATLLVALSAVASAETVPVQIQIPELTQPAPQPLVTKPDSDGVQAERVFGGLLLGLSSAAAFSANIVGALAFVDGAFCDDCDDGSGSGNSTLYNAATGLAIAAAVTAAIGIPLVVAGNNNGSAQKNKRRRVSFNIAPTYGAQQGAGLSASLGVRF